MGCNCKQTSVCSKCQAGSPCGCPPDYTVMPLPVECSKCCPPGYYLSGDICCPVGIPSASCTARDSVAPIPCEECEQSIPAECVIFPQTSCAGNPPGYNLVQVIDMICPSNPAQILRMLQVIGTDPTLKAALCQIVSVCPTVGSATPIPGPIIVSFP